MGISLKENSIEKIDKALTSDRFFLTFKNDVFNTIELSLNSLQNDKILDWSKLEDFADDKINVT